MSPAEVVFDIFGDAGTIADICEIHYLTPYKWLIEPSDRRNGGRGGTGGKVPSQHFPRLIQAAAARGQTLTVEMLFYGKGTTAFVSGLDQMADILVGGK